MAVIITNMNIPKSCAQCNKIGLGFSVNCRKNIYGRSVEGQDARHKDCPLKSTDDIKALEQEPQTFKWCTDCKEYDQENHCCHRWSKVIRDTVEEMKQEPKPMVEIGLYSVIKQKYIEREVLDKIRVEINEISADYTNVTDKELLYRDRVLGIIDKYKAESEG